MKVFYYLPIRLKVYQNIYFLFQTKHTHTHTHTHTQKAKQAKGNRKAKETKVEKEKENVVVNSICGKSNKIQ